jgi:8-oxo-dGTP pyrophosphatase MutT (NUDIX family)
LRIALREAREETGLDDLVPWPGPQLIHVAVLPVAPAAHEPAHEHADLRFLLATGKPDEARPEKPTAPLRWLTFDAAHAELTRPNLREALTRAVSASR